MCAELQRQLHVMRAYVTFESQTNLTPGGPVSRWTNRVNRLKSSGEAVIRASLLQLHKNDDSRTT